jgi:hypothetical protein
VEGEYLCPKCFVTITTGYIGKDDSTFLGDLQHELLIAASMAESLSVIAALAIDGDIDDAPYTEPAKY